VPGPFPLRVRASVTLNQTSLAGTWQVTFLRETEPRAARHHRTFLETAPRGRAESRRGIPIRLFATVP
jgi:hypothetical protein